MELSLSVQAQKPFIKRTYYDYQGRQLHEEYQYIKTANQLVVKHGYYKEYDENGVIQKKYFFVKGLENGVCTDYGDFGDGKGPQPFIVTTYKMGVRHGYTAQWRSDDNNPRHFKSHEGHFYNDRTDGRRVNYELDGSKLVENWYRGARQGKTVEYDAAGNPTREAYHENGKPYTGSLEELFDTDTLKSSNSYEQGMRAGLSQTWYANGKLRSQTPYRDGRQSGPTMHYLETGEPDLATRIALDQSTSQHAVAVRRATITFHQADSLLFITQLEEATSAAARNQTAVAVELYQRVSYKRNAFGQYSADELGEPVYKLYHSVYSRLAADYKAATTDTEQLAKVTRLVMLVNFAENLRAGGPNGLERDLWEAVRQETNLDKVLALTGL